jgi:lipoprotein-anchoring transpeptidase ErfK/SrfK
MSSTADRITSNSLSVLDVQKLEEMQKICDAFSLPFIGVCILVNVATQRLHLITSQNLTSSYSISTAKNGVGQREGTGQTPLGLHFVGEKIGDGANPFEIFKSRVSTGEIAKADVGEKSIIGRILWLQGVQPGLNQGKDSEEAVVDSRDRYIYIHGTNDIANIGKPVSGGCIRMKPDELIELFREVPEKTPVYIYQA